MHGSYIVPFSENPSVCRGLLPPKKTKKTRSLTILLRLQHFPLKPMLSLNFTSNLTTAGTVPSCV
jgi:hypothetical protein